jgi:uncharacterized protein involved in outer membrane biogenesis
MSLPLPVRRPAIIAAAATLGGGLALALAAPVLLDGDAWRGRIEAEAGARLGRKVTVAGPITLRILPSPSATLAAVAVEDVAALDRVRLGLSLGALLAGRPALSDVKIEGGRIGPAEGLALSAASDGTAFDIRGGASLWGRPVTVEARGGHPADGGRAPLRLALAFPGLEGSAVLDGEFGAAGLEAKVELSLASLARAAGSAQLPDAPVAAQAALRVGRDEVTVSDLGVILGETTLTGSVVASLGGGGSPALMDVTLRADSFDLDAGRPRETAPKAPATAGRNAGAAPSAPQPATAQPFELPPGLTANLDLGIGRLAWRGQKVTNLQLNALLEGGRLTVSQASARLPGNGAVKLTGALATPEGRPRFEGELKADGRDLPALRRWLGLGDAATPARARLEGRLRLADERLSLNALTLDLDDRRITGMVSAGLAWPLPLRAELGLPGLAFGFDGALDGGRLEGEASLRAAGIAQAARALGADYRPRGNGELLAGARIEADSAAVAFSGLRVKAGETEITGQGRLSLEGRPKLTATLAGNAIALTPFLPADGKDKADDSRPRRRTGSAAPPPPPVVPAALSSGGGGWSRQPIDLGWLRTLDADLTLEAKAIAATGWRLDQPRAHLALAGGVADLDRLTARLLGGELVAAGRLAANAATLSATLKGADLAQLKPAAGPLKLEKGRLEAEVRLAAAGTSPAALVSSLSGNGRLSATDGEVAGFDLAAMDARMRGLDNLGNLLGLVQAGLAGGTSRFSSLSGTFAADRGVVVSRDLALVAEGGGATGVATVDLPRETIRSRVAFKLATPDAPALGLRLEGPLAAPVKAVDVNDLQRWLMEKGLKNQGGAAGSGDASRKFKAGDALRGLFSTFGRKKAE